MKYKSSVYGKVGGKYIELNLPEWIDASLNLPCNDRDVLVWRGAHLKYAEVAYWSTENGSWAMSNGVLIGHVTHWMPLPDPPKP